ncbi:MAG: hypothetical protein U9R23_06895 [Candidatus Cloacimonadota bacterium]|nr:hypothetical protein [Candidatus Cloacimonadota bacterium]
MELTVAVAVAVAVGSFSEKREKTKNVFMPFVHFVMKHTCPDIIGTQRMMKITHP